MTTDETPSGVRVIAHAPDGTETNVTEGVMALYDLVIGSMDWGSGFLTVEDALPVVKVARTCGFPDYDEAERYVTALAASEEQRRLQHRRLQVAHEQGMAAMAPPYGTVRVPDPPAWDGVADHGHILTSRGTCVWPRCDYSQ